MAGRKMHGVYATIIDKDEGEGDWRDIMVGLMF